MRPAIGAFILILSLAPAAAAVDLTQVATVIDGDTLDLAGTRIRLHGIDAPEAGQACLARGERYSCGQRAAFALANKIGRQSVSCTKRDTDRYGRIVATCYLAGEDLNRWMVREGWAVAYRRYSTAYVADEDQARGARRGLWQGEFVPPWDWRAGTRLQAESAPVEHGATPALMPSAKAAEPEGGACCKRCTKGQPCGNSCISANNQCRQPPGCACRAMMDRERREAEPPSDD